MEVVVPSLVFTFVSVLVVIYMTSDCFDYGQFFYIYILIDKHTRHKVEGMCYCIIKVWG